MTQTPPIQYTKAGEVDIAYRVLGSGPIDIVFVPGLISNLEIEWEDNVKAPLYRQLATFSRLITFDKRGMGLSDRNVGAPTLEERMADVQAVMDAVGSERAALIGASEGGLMSMLFAATFPERTSALVLFGTLARVRVAGDYPHGNEALFPALERILADGWGTGATAEMFAQSWQDHPGFRDSLGRIERASGSPSTIKAVIDGLVNSDVRAALASISAPTLVVHATDDIAVPIGNGRWLADHIDGARFVEIPGEHVVFDVNQFSEEVESFLTGVRPTRAYDRVLSTVMFSDIVGSTEKASALGDGEWRRLLDQHDSITRREIENVGGRWIKSTGDGVLATFDGPARGVACGRQLHQALEPLGIEVRVGLHTGEIELRDDDIGGIAVHIGARVSGYAEAGQVLVSRTVTDLVAGSGLEFTDQGEHTLKGVPGNWQLYAATT
jgi:pimeloyl-ACP methyl ester carboxylesterase